MKRIILGFAIICAILSAFYLAGAAKYPMGRLGAPGAGVWPVLVGVLLLVGSIGLGVVAVLWPPQGELDWPKGRGRWRVVGLVVSSLGYIVIFRYFGQPVATAFVTLVALHVMGMRSWPLKIGLALVAGLGFFYFFSNVLGVPLPRGITHFL